MNMSFKCGFMEILTIIGRVALRGELAKSDSESAESLFKTLVIIFCIVAEISVSAVCIISERLIEHSQEWVSNTVTN